jgi:hypothetical protein
MRLVAFAPNSRSVVLRDLDERTLRLWEVPAPLEGEVERILCWTEVITGVEMDTDGVVHVLDAAAWHERRRRLDDLGGPAVGGIRKGGEATLLHREAPPAKLVQRLREVPHRDE